MCLIKIRQGLFHLYKKIQQNDVSATGAQLSYYIVLSFFPFLIFLINLLRFTPLTQEHTIHNLSLIIPEEAFDIIYIFIDEIVNSNNAILSIGMIGTIWASSKGTSALIKGINSAYNTEENRSFIKVKFLGIIFTISLAFIIIFSLILLVFGQVLGEFIFNNLGISQYFYYIWTILRYTIPLICLFATFLFIYIFAPNIKLKPKDVFLGAIFSTVGWIAVSLAFSFYVNNFNNYTRTYGSIGGVIILLVWLYLSSIIVLLGAEINSTIYFLFRKNPKHAISKTS